jgi:hypothetical protein
MMTNYCHLCVSEFQYAQILCYFRKKTRTHEFSDDNLWDPDDTSSMTSDNSVHAVSKLEAYLYYFGLHGDRHLGPKLIYRTSADEFKAPSEARTDPRKIQLLSMQEHAVLDKLNLWPMICMEVHVILKA